MLADIHEHTSLCTTLLLNDYYLLIILTMQHFAFVLFLPTLFTFITSRLYLRTKFRAENWRYIVMNGNRCYEGDIVGHCFSREKESHKDLFLAILF